MPEFAKSYDFGDTTEVPTIDGEPIPWYVSTEGPLVQREDATNGATHILWIPILIDAPMPTPPEGRPIAEPLACVRIEQGQTVVGAPKNAAEPIEEPS